MVDPKSTEWTDEEQEVAVAILGKIAYCQNKGKDMPGEVFEAHVRSKKNISTELALFNEKGKLYLVRRPTPWESPSEPYPGQLHCPGVTHGKNEFLGNTFERLKRREGVDFDWVIPAATVDATDSERGMYTLRIFIALARGIPTNPRGAFFFPHTDGDGLVASHRDFVIPAAMKKYREVRGY
ncbi:MAG: hypothetical protein HY435_03050 [Candidatus Liptonbacteria bacterium]|nr:hypothetical protein [Candidatus Liptonbacteria bacterium]